MLKRAHSYPIPISHKALTVFIQSLRACSSLNQFSYPNWARRDFCKIVAALVLSTSVSVCPFTKLSI